MMCNCALVKCSDGLNWIRKGITRKPSGPEAVSVLLLLLLLPHLLPILLVTDTDSLTFFLRQELTNPYDICNDAHPLRK